jgi:hypothetical protein
MLILLLLLGGADGLSAQAPNAGTADSAALAAHGVRPGRTVRVAVPGDGRLAGDVTALDGGGFTLALPGGERRFPTLPDTLWTRGRAVVPGAIVGGIAGVVGGIFVGLIGNALCEYDCGSPVSYAAAGGLLFGVGGAALGSLVGAAIPRWQRRVP